MPNIETGTKLMVTTLAQKDSSEHSGYVLTSSFEDSLPDGTFLIHAPFYKDLIIPIPVSAACMISYHDPKANYSFEGVVVERVTRGDLKFLRLKQTTETVRTQRREDFRLQALLDCKLDQAYMTPENERKIRRLPSITVDISGGGASIRLQTKLDIGEIVVFHMPLGEKGGMLSFPSEVRWVYKNDNPDTVWKWNIGLKFLFKNKADKETLVKTIFALQAAQRRKRST